MRGLDRHAAANGKTMACTWPEASRSATGRGCWQYCKRLAKPADAAGQHRNQCLLGDRRRADARPAESARRVGAADAGRRADVFHQEFVPFERARCVETARTMLGPTRPARWWDFYNAPLDLTRAGEAERRQAFDAALPAPGPPDRAGRTPVAPILPRYPAAQFRGETAKAILGSRHVHIDGHGNIFPGVCSGIILGNAVHATVQEVWQDAQHWQDNPVVALVCGGSYEPLRRAGPRLPESPGGYANKCHLCACVRQFLFERHIWPEVIGPAECYADQAEQRAADASTGV